MLGTVVICTALDIEYIAVREHLEGPFTEREERGSLYEIGAFSTDHGRWTVALIQTGAGNTQAGLQLERAITVFHPTLVLFVGVAGGRKDVALGDVVIADAIYDYEAGKDTLDGYLPRIKTTAPSHHLLGRAVQLARDNTWQHRILPSAPGNRPRAVVKPIAAGGKVIADQNSALAQFLHRHCGDAAAVEMEGHGFLHGAYVNNTVQALVVRGISDLLSGKTEKADTHWQTDASRHAAAFAAELLTRHTAPPNPAASTAPRQLPAAPPVRRALFALDVESSGDLRRDNVAWDELKRALYRATQVAFAASGIDLARLQVRDTGDGMIVEVPDTVDRGRLLHPLLAVLAQELRAHNQRASQAAQIRVRVALHDADVMLDESGFPGGPHMVHLARLLDSARLRDELRRAPATATVAAILSDRFHGSVVRHGYPGVDAELFHQVKVRVKETTATGWIHLPGHRSRPPRRRRVVAVVAAVVVTALTVTGVVWLGRGDQDAGGTPEHQDTPSTHLPPADLNTTVPPNTAPTPSRPTTVVTTPPVGNCTDLYFEQDPKIPEPWIYQLPEGATAERVNPGLSKYPVGGLLLRDRKPLGAIKFFYEEPGVGFSVINVVDATCAPVQATSRKVATNTYVAAFRLGTDNFEVVVKLNGLADVTFHRP